VTRGDLDALVPVGRDRGEDRGGSRERELVGIEAHDLVTLPQEVATGTEHALAPTVAEEDCALVELEMDRVHVTSPSFEES
jgi:hypothetical protein